MTVSEEKLMQLTYAAENLKGQLQRVKAQLDKEEKEHKETKAKLKAVQRELEDCHLNLEDRER